MKKRLKAFVFAFNGIKWLLKTQPNAQIHLVATLLVVVSGIFFRISNTEWLLVVLAIGAVFSAEAFNTAIEEIVNFISPDYHEKAGKIKDVAAGAVLLISLSAAITGSIIFIPKIIQLL